MKKVCSWLLKWYQRRISPFFQAKGIHCKFYPSCSEYMLQAIQKYGCMKGIVLGVKRLLKCHPFAKGGYDPLD